MDTEKSAFERKRVRLSSISGTTGVEVGADGIPIDPALGIGPGAGDKDGDDAGERKRRSTELEDENRLPKTTMVTTTVTQVDGREEGRSFSDAGDGAGGVVTNTHAVSTAAAATADADGGDVDDDDGAMDSNAPLRDKQVFLLPLLMSEAISPPTESAGNLEELEGRRMLRGARTGPLRTRVAGPSL